MDGRDFLRENASKRMKGFRSLSQLWNKLNKRGGKESFASDPAGEAASAWKRDVLARLRTEGFIGRRHLLDPVRTAICLSHQRALQCFLDGATNGNRGGGNEQTWGLIFEDDVRPGEALASFREEEITLEVPDGSEVLFLHDRVWKRGSSASGQADGCEGWRVTRGGIGLEAYAVTVTGARKMLSAFRPVIEECDIQLMTFMEGFADLEYKEELHTALRKEGQKQFPSIRAYAPVEPLFQTDHWQPSVKFNTIAEGKGG